MSEIKRKKTELEFDFTIKNRLVLIDGQIKRNTNLNWNYMVGAYTYYQGGEDYSVVEIDIEINPLKIPFCYTNLVAELKDTVRHEIEHVTQSIIKTKPKYRRSNNWINLFISKAEVSAYLQGFLVHAKTLKIPMNTVIDNFLNMYSEKFSGFTEKELEKIKVRWIMDGKKILPNAWWV